MYIEYEGKQYPCHCRPGAVMVYTGLPEDLPAPVEGAVMLCRDDGFVLREDDPKAYLRQTFADGVLTLTNEPEPEPVTEPDAPEAPAEPSAIEQLRADVDYLAIMTGVQL